MKIKQPTDISSFTGQITRGRTVRAKGCDMYIAIKKDGIRQITYKNSSPTPGMGTRGDGRYWERGGR